MSSLLDENQGDKEEILDSALRPKNWDDYVGQEKIKENIKIIITTSIISYI
jgi:Holliday junction resolvasome RuvABC ATP-dependent DNA helicase subunit